MTAFEHVCIAGWAHMDANGHMRNTAFIDLAVDTRLLYLASAGFDATDMVRHAIGSVVRRDDIEYYTNTDSTIPRNAKGYTGEHMPWAEFLSFARQVKNSGRPAPNSAPKEVQLLDVLDQTAAAKVTAYWGTDYLLLAKFNGQWMITHVLWQSPPVAGASRP